MSFDSSKVIRLREALCLDQKEFAKLMSVSDRTVIRWEAGSPAQIPGTAGHVLSAFHHALEKHGEKFVMFINESTPIGGLAYVMTRLITKLIERQQDVS
jgi:transcriptional regulator with XRE-family HTH domain